MSKTIKLNAADLLVIVDTLNLSLRLAEFFTYSAESRRSVANRLLALTEQINVDVVVEDEE